MCVVVVNEHCTFFEWESQLSTVFFHVLQELEEQISRQAEDAAVTRALRADIEKVPDLEREVTRLRNENEYWR